MWQRQGQAHVCQAPKAMLFPLPRSELIEHVLYKHDKQQKGVQGERGCGDQEGNTQQTDTGELGTSLVVQWLKLCTPSAGGEGSIVGSHMPQLGVCSKLE